MNQQLAEPLLAIFRCHGASTITGRWSRFLDLLQGTWVSIRHHVDGCRGPMALTHTQVRDRFARMRGFMVADSRRGLHNAQANYLVALGILTYIEAIGGLITGTAGIPSRYSRSNFNAALAQMTPG